MLKMCDKTEVVDKNTYFIYKNTYSTYFRYKEIYKTCNIF